MTAARFEHELTIPLQDVDAAGVVFFAHVFRYAHEAYERFMAEQDLALPQLIRSGEYLLPLVHAQADYRRPLRHGERIRIELSVAEIGESSYTLRSRLLDVHGQLRAEVRSVHVALDPGSQRPMPLPAVLREALTRYRAA